MSTHLRRSRGRLSTSATLAVRPLCISSCKAYAFGRVPSLPLAPLCRTPEAEPPQCTGSELSRREVSAWSAALSPPPSDPVVVRFAIRSPVDVLRICARALWLGVVMLPPLLLLLPAALFQSDSLWRRLEAEVLNALERGGPCLIKLGQWASTRPDVLPLSVCRTLGSLHDAVPSHSLEHTMRSIEAAFGAPVGRHFRALNERPVGSGCIAQVHEAETVDGARVAIKVLHPGVERLIAIDVYVLRSAAALVEALLPLRGLRWLSLAESVDAFADFMSRQLDLRHEARNLERFRAHFVGGGGGEVAFPRPYAEEGLVARSVLVESFVEGEVLTKLLRATRRRRAAAAEAAAAGTGAAGMVAPAAPPAVAADELGELGLGAGRDAELARRGLVAFFTMILRHNFVHADLHPGNIMVGPPASAAAPLALSFVDAGLAVELSERDRANFRRLFRALGAGDGRRAAELMLEHAREQACDDPEAFKAGVERIVKGVGLGPRGSFNLRALRIGDVLLELTTLVRVHKVKVEPNFTTLVMAIVVLEGLGRQLDPSLDLFAVATPMLIAG